MNARRFAIALGALLLSLGLAGSAHAAQVLEVTYDLSDTTLNLDAGSTQSHTATGNMVVLYATDGSEILPGSAKIQSFTLTYNAVFGGGPATVTAKLLSPVTGSASVVTGTPTVTPVTNLTGWKMSVQGTFHCTFGTPTCTNTVGYTLSDPNTFSTTTTGPAQLTGIYGGTNSTGTAATNTQLHTLSGTVQGTFTVFPGPLGINATSVAVVGREVSRQIIPEPGSLLLLGSGLAGLAALGGTGGLVSQRLRRRRHEDA